MHDFKYVQAEAVEEWSQGEWDFFADKCMEMGLDPENSIIYPEEDTEIDDVEDIDRFDSEHAVSHLKKLGSYLDPVMTKSPNRTFVSKEKLNMLPWLGMVRKAAWNQKREELRWWALNLKCWIHDKPIRSIGTVQKDGSKIRFRV
ncbi:hypothetical protein L1987_00002 [Smallanthus sonchifolius]|uniref:Uncharacterized protein n=1 Tax=Smallanthus sonchifolius TaxID=185202 RepID=A0ACB9K1A8_9ASTR|nr:hypothetical protein L1987_00002 [Smallanthus sonchifolius]